MAMASPLQSDLLEQFDRLSTTAFAFVTEGLDHEEKGNQAAALLAYEECLHLLDRALEVNFVDDDGGEKVKQAVKSKAKMSRTRQEVAFRIREIQSAFEKSEEVKCDAETYDICPLPSDAEILFTIVGKVHVFYISVDGKVSSPSFPSTLRIFKFKGSDDNTAFLQVGTWVYPLIAGKSPVLKSKEGSYLFPDLDDKVEGNAIGLVLPPEILDVEKRQFEDILNRLASRNDDIAQYDDYIEFSSQVSGGLVKGADLVGRGLIKGTVKATEWIHFGAEKLKDRIEPEIKARKVDPKLQTGLEAAQWVSSKAVGVSGFLVSKAGAATVALGRLLAPHIKKQSTLALSHIVEQSEEKSHKQLTIASELAGGTVQAFGTLYMALENSSKILAKNVANNTVMLVSHKYGSDVGKATDNALSVAGNSYMTAYNAAVLAPKGLAKSAAKTTGKMMVGVPEDVILGRQPLEHPDDENNSQVPAITDLSSSHEKSK